MQKQVRKNIGKMSAKNMKMEPTLTPKGSQNQHKSGKSIQQPIRRIYDFSKGPGPEWNLAVGPGGSTIQQDILRIGVILGEKLIGEELI